MIRYPFAPANGMRIRISATDRLKILSDDATNRRDAEGVAATFTPDADLLVANGPRFIGVDEIQRNEEEFYSTPGFQQWHATIESIRFLSADVAIVEQIATTTLEGDDTHESATGPLTELSLFGWVLTAATFVVIVLTWNEYFMGITSIVYIPDMLDSFFPFLMEAPVTGDISIFRPIQPRLRQ